MAWIAPYWRGSVDANNAMSAIDGALWDIFNKRTGVPVYNFLGGKVRPALPMFAGVAGSSLQEQEENARRAIETGYKYLRVAAVGKQGNLNQTGGGGRGQGTGGSQAPSAGRGQGNAIGGGGLGSANFGERGPIYAEPRLHPLLEPPCRSGPNGGASSDACQRVTSQFVLIWQTVLAGRPTAPTIRSGSEAGFLVVDGQQRRAESDAAAVS